MRQGFEVDFHIFAQEFKTMRNPSVILVILSLLFLVIPIIQQMIKVKQESKLVLLTDTVPNFDESSSEYGDTDIEDLNVLSLKKIEFYCCDFVNYTHSYKATNYHCGRKLESPPPQA